MPQAHQAPPSLEVVDLQSALRAIVDRDFIRNQKWAAQQGRANRQGAHPLIVQFERKLIRELADRHGVPMYAHCVVRTADEQLRLFKDGKSKDSPADGRWPHKAFAVDIVHSVKHWDMHEKSWAMIGHIGKEVAKRNGIKITWGGDWKFYDPAHWELTEWRRLNGEKPW